MAQKNTDEIKDKKSNPSKEENKSLRVAGKPLTFHKHIKDKQVFNALFSGNLNNIIIEKEKDDDYKSSDYMYFHKDGKVRNKTRLWCRIDSITSSKHLEKNYVVIGFKILSKFT